MIPKTFPSRINPYGTEVEMVGYYLGSVVGLTKWTDYIPVRVVQTTPSTEGSEDTAGYQPVGALASISGLMAWNDYVPLYIDNSLTVPWSTDANGYIPVGIAGGGAAAANFTFAGADAVDTRITFTRADASTCATYFDKWGALKLAAANIPRLDYDPVTLVPRGLLIEESRQNLFLNSLLNGTNLTTQSITVTAVPWTISFYGTGSITLSGVSSGVITGTGASVRTSSTFTPTAGSLTCTVSGTVKWANAELGSFPTSFIPTAGSPVTRAADSAVMTGANFSSWFNATEGTFVLDGVFSNTTSDPTARVCISVSDATFNESIYIGRTAASAAMTINIIDGGVAQIASNNIGNIIAGSVFRSALTYKLNNSSGALNGVAIASDTVCTMPTVDRLSIGNGSWSGAANIMNGWIKKLTYYSTQLTTAQLQSLTRL